MKVKKVEEILLPFRAGMAVHPSVSARDKITFAIELMLKNNLKSIAVVRGKRPIGMIRLKDAFKTLGLEMPGKSSPLP